MAGRIARRCARESAPAERGEEPVGQREQGQAREDRPAQRGAALPVHFRNQVRRGHVDRDAGGHGERIPHVVLGDEAGRDRAGDRQGAERRTRADRRRARVPAGEHDRRDREALGHLVEEDGHGEERAERGSDHEAGGDRDAVEERVHAEAEQREPARRGIEERLGMHLFAEVEVGRDRVLEEVNAEVADEDEEEGVTTPDVVEEALARAKTTGERLGEALVALGAVKSEEVLRALAQQQNLAYLSRDELPSPLPIVKNLSAKYLRQYAVCPVSVENGQLRSEEHTSELQSHSDLVCRLLLEK